MNASCSRRATRWMFALSLLFAIAPAANAQLDVESTHFGFDGALVLGAFQPISVQVVWRGAVPWRGVVELRRQGAISETGVALAREVTLQPGERRWIQFVPFCVDAEVRYQLTADGVEVRGGELPEVTFRASAMVHVRTKDSGSFSMPALPAELWPTSVSATSGLVAVLLDRVPDWDSTRCRSFRDWLWCGGKALIVRQSSVPLEFTGELAELSFEGQRRSVGCGEVVQFEGVPPRGEEALRRWCASRLSLALEDGEPVPWGDLAALSESWRERFASVRRLVLPRHPWLLIALLGVLFCLWVGPVQFWLRRRWPGGGRMIGGVLVGSALTSIGFFALCMRGHDQVAGVIGVQLARHLGEDRYEIVRVMDAATSGAGRYRFTLDAESVLSDTVGAQERIRGSAQAGSLGLELTLPVFSHQGVLQRVVARRTTPISFEIESWPENVTLQGLELSLSTGLSQQIRAMRASGDGRHWIALSVPEVGEREASRWRFAVLGNEARATDGWEPTTDGWSDPLAESLFRVLRAQFSDPWDIDANLQRRMSSAQIGDAPAQLWVQVLVEGDPDFRSTGKLPGPDRVITVLEHVFYPSRGNR